ncbi:hypothetical protein A471_13836 [Ectopseudomonas mendocina DLHK]|nr:hypothetical protein A471_13836 [Pseudomonas mendocina DLHK]
MLEDAILQRGEAAEDKIGTMSLPGVPGRAMGARFDTIELVPLECCLPTYEVEQSFNDVFTAFA